MLIIGAGVSGLAAAADARRYRVFDGGVGAGRTRRFKTGGDAGAQFFTKFDTYVSRTVRRLGLRDTVRVYPLNRFTCQHANKEKKELTDVFSKLDEKRLATIAEAYSGEPFSNFLNEHHLDIKTTSTLCRAITFSEPEELDALYGAIATASAFQKVYTFNGGIATLASAMTAALTAQITAANIASIDLEEKQVCLESGAREKYDRLILATNAKSAASLIPKERVAVLLRKVRYKQAVAVKVSGISGNEYGRIQESFVLLGPKTNQTQSHTAVFYGKNIIKKPTKNLAKELEEIFGEPIQITERIDWPLALPTYGPETGKLQAKIKENLPEELALAGDYLSMPSLDGAIETGETAIRQANLI